MDALPDELLSLLFHALPVVRRLRACLVSRRFKRLLFTPALHAALSRAHTLPAGSALQPRSFITSPDGRFRFIFQNEANVVLYYAAAATRLVCEASPCGRCRLSAASMGTRRTD